MTSVQHDTVLVSKSVISMSCEHNSHCSNVFGLICGKTLMYFFVQSEEDVDNESGEEVVSDAGLEVVGQALKSLSMPAVSICTPLAI